MVTELDHNLVMAGKPSPKVKLQLLPSCMILDSQQALIFL
jgi:hypothetical protein